MLIGPRHERQTRVVVSKAPLTQQSTRVRQARRLTRRAARVSSRQFLAEGPQAVREALGVDGCVQEVFATPAALERHRDLAALAREASVTVRLCDDTAVASLAGSVSPQGIIAICGFIDVPLADAFPIGSRLVAVGAHVREPGNAGSLLRCADAAGADAVVLAGSSVDPYNDKAVRSATGSLFHLPLVFGPSVPEALDTLRMLGFAILAADGSAPTTLDDVIDSGLLVGSVAWVFGNEAWGIPADEQALADQAVAVPIHGKAESLNVAMAAAVCLYATAREQRRASS